MKRKETKSMYKQMSCNIITKCIDNSYKFLLEYIYVLLFITYMSLHSFRMYAFLRFSSYYRITWSWTILTWNSSTKILVTSSTKDIPDDILSIRASFTTPLSNVILHYISWHLYWKFTSFWDIQSKSHFKHLISIHLVSMVVNWMKKTIEQIPPQ